MRRLFSWWLGYDIYRRLILSSPYRSNSNSNPRVQKNGYKLGAVSRIQRRWISEGLGGGMRFQMPVVGV